ncbi:MAG: UDP-N-acetylmuramoyl-tripeptide--D-alanyl-D-alanine ligase, partial [Patescibacteria group bacterium]
YRHLQSTGGMVFVNKDEKYLTTLAGDNKYQLLYEEKNEALHLNEVALLASHPLVKSAFRDNETGDLVEVNSHLMGVYNFSNIMTAIVTGRYFKVATAKIKEAIESYVPTNNRSQLITEGTNTYLMDAYNANPDSMSKALTYFSTMPADKRIVILGDMLELGPFSEEEHENIVTLALEKNFTDVWLVGRAFNQTSQKAEHIRRFVTINDLKNWYADHTVTNAHFLLKGSREIKLESFLEIT